MVFRNRKSSKTTNTIGLFFRSAYLVNFNHFHPDYKIGFFILISINATKARNSETEPQLVCSKLTIETLKQGVKYVKS